MTNDVARALADSLTPLYNSKIITVLAGLSKMAVTETRDQKTLRYPVPYDNDSQPMQVENDSLIPNQNQRAIVYFEGTDSDVTSYEDTKSKMRSNLRLVCWYNSQMFQLEEGQSLHTTLVSTILKLLPTAKNYSNQLLAMEVRATRVYDSAATLFSRYTYREERGQFLLAPYFALGIDLTVSYQLNHECHAGLIPIKSSVCC